MMGLQTVIMLSTVVALSTAPWCCMPPQWEGKQTEAGVAVINQQGVKTTGFADISYDIINQKVSVISNRSVGGNQTHTWVIKHGKEGLMYVIDLMVHKCTKMNITTPITDICVPDYAKLGDTFVYGGGGKVLECQTYTWKQTEPGIDFDIFVSLDNDLDRAVYYPVVEVVSGLANGVSQITTYGFFDLIWGIMDPSIFTPPSFCNQVPVSGVSTKKGYSFLGL